MVTSESDITQTFLVTPNPQVLLSDILNRTWKASLHGKEYTGTLINTGWLGLWDGTQTNTTSYLKVNQLICNRAVSWVWPWERSNFGSKARTRFGTEHTWDWIPCGYMHWWRVTWYVWIASLPHVERRVCSLLTALMFPICSLGSQYMLGRYWH